MADSESRAGLRYADKKILEFVEETHHPHTSGLARAFDAPDRQGIPAIQVSPADGATISLLLTLAGTRRAVEIGTLAGYSALCIARALPDDGYLWTVEADPRHAQIARDNIEAAGEAARIEVVERDGMAALTDLEAHGPFCAVFIDADKGRYDQYAAWAIENLRPGGLLIGDNAYFFGNLLADEPAAAAMRRFHSLMAEGMTSVCIPTPDGLAVGIKRHG